ncbi:MAG: DNA repair protein RecO [Methylobacter sp.]
MTESAVYLQPAFILQHRKYRETSLILDALTRDFGRVSLLAKGVRKIKSKTAGILQPFIPLTVSYFGRSELKTLADVERRIDDESVHGIASIIQPVSELKGLALYCGFYVNELIGCFLHKDDPHPEVFADYQACLASLAEGLNLEAALRLFELNLMENVGYGLQFDYDENGKPVEPAKQYDYNVGQGPVETVRGQFSGKTLQSLSARDVEDPQVLHEAKSLMRMVIDIYLQGKPLKSRAVINQVIATTQ